jgi:hypothetical protein
MSTPLKMSCIFRLGDSSWFLSAVIWHTCSEHILPSVTSPCTSFDCGSGYIAIGSVLLDHLEQSFFNLITHPLLISLVCSIPDYRETIRKMAHLPLIIGGALALGKSQVLRAPL